MPTDSAPPALKICDLVMQGGITSGVVYPGAVCELARQYRFHSIGGSSAGAIAAALTAAAEYRRQSQPEHSDAGFVELAQLPDELGAKIDGRSRLVSLFQPQASVARLFNTLLGLAGGGGGAPLRLLRAGFANYGWPSIAVIAVLLLCVLTPVSSDAFGLILQLLALTALLLLLPLAVLLLGMLRDLRKLPRHGYAFCTGATTAKSATPGLSDWLHAKLQATAGKPPDQPLVFADLWQSAHPYDGRNGDEQHRGIDLRVTTTSLTWQQLLCLPSDGGDYGRLYFRADEFARLFPQAIVTQMVEASRTDLAERLERAGRSDESSKDRAAEAEGYYRMPNVGALPVLVAVRMSLSFPVLLAPIKLYERDYSRLAAKVDDPAVQKERDAQVQQQMRAVWFSDGGICSNMPVHFFDAPVPTHPTFALHLAAPHPDAALRPDLRKAAWVGQRPLDGTQPGRYAMHEHDGAHDLLHFLFAIVDAARNWTDHNLMRLDGYRDRIAHIALQAQEGGMNLAMPAALIGALSQRGQDAAQQLAQRYDDVDDDVRDDKLSFLATHRWIRICNAQYALAESLAKVREAFDRVPHPLQGRPNPSADERTQLDFGARLDALISDPAFARLRQLQLKEREQRARAAHFLSYRPELRLRARL